MNDQKKGKIYLTDGRVFNFEDHTLYSDNNVILKSNLQSYEYDVFYCLAENYPSPKSVNQLISLIWEKKTTPITPDPSRVRQVIGNLRAFLDDKKPFRFIIWVNKGIYSEGGYKCCSSLVHPKPDSEDNPVDGDRVPSENESKNIGQRHQQTVNVNNSNIIDLASLIIHKNSADRPPIDNDLKYEVSEILKLLEQGLSEDFEEVCEQAWEEMNLMQKAMKIFRAYENLTDRVPNMSPTDTNTRL